MLLKLLNIIFFKKKFYDNKLLLKMTLIHFKASTAKT